MSRVLVIDRDSDVREALAEVLADGGHAAEGAETSEGALERMRVNLPDLVLADSTRDAGEDEAFFVALRGDPRLRSVPMVLMSAAFGRRELARCARRFGAAAWLEKPMHMTELLELVELHAFDRRSA